jgi:hypothetical protein
LPTPRIQFFRFREDGQLSLNAIDRIARNLRAPYRARRRVAGSRRWLANGLRWADKRLKHQHLPAKIN